MVKSREIQQNFMSIWVKQDTKGQVPMNGDYGQILSVSQINPNIYVGLTRKRVIYYFISGHISDERVCDIKSGLKDEKSAWCTKYKCFQIKKSFVKASQ